MASIYVFCELSELRDWTVRVCQHYGLGVLYFRDTGEDVAESVEPIDLLLTDDIYQIFLFPKSTSIPPDLSMNNVRQREWGWVNIRPGGVKSLGSGTCLLRSEIHGEKCALPTVNPDKWVSWQKRKIKLEVSVGVVGKNVKYGGAKTYNNIWYSKMAVDLFHSGTVWKQFTSDNSAFEPIS